MVQSEPNPADATEHLNDQLRSTLSSGPFVPSTLHRSVQDGTAGPSRGLGANRLTGYTWPLPERGIFRQARVARSAGEAIALLSIKRVGGAYVCLGYEAVIDRHNPQASLAGPYAGPCKRWWLVQLGIVPSAPDAEVPRPVEPVVSPDPAPASTAAPPPP